MSNLTFIPAGIDSSAAASCGSFTKVADPFKMTDVVRVAGSVRNRTSR